MSTDPFLTQLATLCRSDLTRAKWVLVPGHSLGHTLGERLALESGSWANVRFTTPFDLAVRTAAPFLVERGINPIGDDLGPSLMMRLLRELPASVPMYFRQLAVHPTMGAALWSSLMELRLAGVSAGDLSAGAFEHPDKHAELQALFFAYEAWLVAERRADTASIYREALEHPVAGPVRPSDLVFELPDTCWPPLVRRFLDALPGTKIAPHVPRLPGHTLPRRLAALPRAERATAAPLAWLKAPAALEKRASKAQVALFRAGGPEAEVEEIFRRILHAPGGPRRLDEVEIACASSDYPLIVWHKAERYGWPVTLASGLPGSATRPVRAMLAWCEWIANGFAAGHLRRMLASGDIRVDIPDGPGSNQAAGLLLRAGPTWGRRSYALALDALAVSERKRAEEPDTDDEERAWRLRRADQAERLRDWVESVLAPIPDTDAETVPVQALVDAAADFVSRVAAVANELDGQAIRSVKDALQELRLLGDAACPASAALNMVRAALDGVRVASSRARPGHLHVTMLPRAGYAGRRHTFIVGLQEGQVFPSLFEDPVLLDAERRRLHDSLAESGDRTAETVHHVVTRLATLRGSEAADEPNICLSYSCRDLRDARQTFPSWLMLHACRLTQPGKDITYKELDEALGEPVSQVPRGPDSALGDAGWWIANLKGGPNYGAERVFSAFPSLRQGAFAASERDSDRFTVFDGLVTSAAAVLDPRRSARAVSPTSLEKLAACPFAYFLEYGLGLEAIEEEELDEDVWLGPATRGSLLHGLYADMMRELRQRKQKADPARHLAWLTARADDELAELREAAPPPSEEVFTREREALLRDLELFLLIERDAARSGVTPVAFEVAFAGRGESGDEPLGQAEPVTVTLPGLRFLLGGRIDRIDRLPDGTYEVVDYKTGSFYRIKYQKTFRNGRLLQHALYSLAAEKLLRSSLDPKAKVVAGRYSFPTVKGARQSVRIPSPAAAQVAGVMGELLDIIGGGAFMTTTRKNKKGDCTFCELGTVCGGKAAIERSSLKLKNPANTALGPFLRLQGKDYD